MHVTEPSRWLLLRQRPFDTFEYVGQQVEHGSMYPYNTSTTFLVVGFTLIQGTTSKHLRRTSFLVPNQTLQFGMLVGTALET